MSRGKRYFANLSLSTNGSNFKTVKLQIDTGAICNTISYKDTVNLPGTVLLTKSLYTLQPYGNSSPVKPVGQVELICEREPDSKRHHSKSSQMTS